MSFEHLIGNEKIKDFIEKSIEENHVSHSYLFIGIDGIRKKIICF